MKGNELEWLITLAELKFRSEEFQKFLRNEPELSDTLDNLMRKFRPDVFNYGTSRTIWTLKIKEPSQS
jgi:hypothetical protein